MTLGDRVAVLRDGTIQQCDTPERLFESPANLFVAAFMGSPPMNLVEGEVRDGRLHMAGIEVPLPEGVRHQGAVIAGVRPTDLVATEGDGPRPARGARGGRAAREREPRDLPRRRAAPTGEAAAAADEATEDGDATLLAADDRARFTAVVPGRTRLSVGDVLELRVAPETVHLFDPESGAALT